MEKAFKYSSMVTILKETFLKVCTKKANIIRKVHLLMMDALINKFQMVVANLYII